MPEGKQVIFNGSFVVDDFARFLKILALVGSAAAILMSIDYARREQEQRFEYSVLILLSTLGMMMLISAADLIALYLGLELMSLPLYVVAASHRTVAALDRGRPEIFRPRRAVVGHAALRRLAGLRLHRHGDFVGIAHSAADAGTGLIFGLVFLFAGFCFKVSAVPFHMWTPDVYEGAPTPVTAFFAAAPKVAGIAMFVRVAVSAFPGITAQWQEIVAFVSIASMLLGSFAAIGQRNIKRLMAYSSIGHMGFALVGLAAGTAEGVQGVLVYMAIYVTMTLGVFAVILSMRRGEGMVESIDQLAGLARTNPGMAFFLAMLLFSMAGMPPLAGFFAKFYVFLAAIQAGLYLARRDRRAGQRGRRLLLSGDRQDHVFRRAGEGVRADAGRTQSRARRLRGLQSAVLCLSGPAGRRRQCGRAFAVLMQLPSAAQAAGFRWRSCRRCPRPMQRR